MVILPPLNKSAVGYEDCVLIEHVNGDVWKAIESQPYSRADHAKKILEDHNKKRIEIVPLNTYMKNIKA